MLGINRPLPSRHQLYRGLNFSHSTLHRKLAILHKHKVVRATRNHSSHITQLGQIRSADPLVRLFDARPQALCSLLSIHTLLRNRSTELTTALKARTSFIIVAHYCRGVLTTDRGGGRVSLVRRTRLSRTFRLTVYRTSRGRILIFALRSLASLVFGSIFTDMGGLCRQPRRGGRVSHRRTEVCGTILRQLPRITRHTTHSRIQAIGGGLRSVRLRNRRLVHSTIPLRVGLD